jgi:hypothetical protein
MTPELTAFISYGSDNLSALSDITFLKYLNSSLGQSCAKSIMANGFEEMLFQKLCLTLSSILQTGSSEGVIAGGKSLTTDQPVASALHHA